MIPRSVLAPTFGLFAGLCILAFPAVAADSIFDLGRAQDIAARPMALGGSYTAVATDASALYYNAAGLSSVKKHELSLSLDRTVLQTTDQAGGYPSLSRQAQNMRIQSLEWLLPVPTVRGGLTFAFGYYRPRTFDEIISYDDAKSAANGTYVYKADGNLGNYRMGMGVDIAPDLSFGLALGYVAGTENIHVSDSGEVAELRSYDGLNLEPSLMFKISPRFRAGASLVLWEDIFNLQDVIEKEGEGNSEYKYQVSYPFQVKSGIAYQGNTFLLSADAHWNAFSQYAYGSKSVSTLDKAQYNDEWILSAGAEKFLPEANTVLRAGYTFNTWPETFYATNYDLHRLSAGVGFLFSGSLSLDLAYAYSFWGLGGDGLTLDNREHRAMMTMAFRY